MKPRPIRVVKSKCGLSSTLIIAPRAWLRSDVHAIHHRSGGAVPLAKRQDLAAYCDSLL